MAEDRIIIVPRQATGNTKFDVMIRTHELRQLENVLKGVHAMNGKERSAWVHENGSIFSQAFDRLLSDTSQTLDGLSMDNELLALSQELVSTLRDTSELLDGLVNNTPRLNS